MPSAPRLTIPLLAAALLAACAGPRMKVSYPRPQTPEQEALVSAVSNAYLLVRKPKRIADAVPDPKLRQQLEKVRWLGRRTFDVDAGAFARETHERLARLGGAVMAYRVTEDLDAADPYVERLAPSGVLAVSFESLDLAGTKTEKTVTARVRKVKDGEAVYENEERKVPSWDLTARLHLRARLRAHPGGEVLLDRTFAVEHAETGVAGSDLKPTAQAPSEELRWFEKSGSKMLDQAATALAAALGRVPAVTRTREVFVDKEDPASKEAAGHAQAGRWERASELWAERLEGPRGNWRDLANLGLAAEQRRFYAEAARIYRDAREKAAGDPGAAKVEFDETIADLEAASRLFGERSREGLDWFSVPVAVLPFSDETTSVTGPELVRELTYQTLEKGGYRVLPLEDVDRALRRNGFSQGGQLKFGKPADFSSWVEAPRLIFGHLAEFRDLMLGAYGKRVVAGELKLWDAARRDAVWSGAEPAIREEAAGSEEEAKSAFARQLTRGFIERWRRKPLFPESRAFVGQNLETLPLRPPLK